MKNQEKLSSKRRSIKLLVIIIGVIVITTGITTWSASRTYSTNYAEETVRPLEKALVEKGGIKYYENGDSGRGIDNKSPWLQVFYEMPFDVQESLKLINVIAKENGYTLTHASPQNRGPMSVADIFIDRWYYDYTSKTAGYSDLRSGPVRLALIVDGPDSTYSSGRTIPEGHSIVGIDLALPSYK